MSKQATLFKLKSKPNSKLKKILDNIEARSLWCIYRSGHIISKEGLSFLNRVCLEMVDEKTKFKDESEAEKFLRVFEYDISYIEYGKTDFDWIEKCIPYLIGKKTIEVEIINE